MPNACRNEEKIPETGEGKVGFCAVFSVKTQNYDIISVAEKRKETGKGGVILNRWKTFFKLMPEGRQNRQIRYDKEKRRNRHAA